MAATTRCIGFSTNSDGHAAITFETGDQIEFPNLISMRAYADVDTGDALDMVRKFMVAWLLARDPTGQNGGLVVGRTMTIDMNSALMIEVTGP